MAFDVVIEPASGSVEITGSSLTFIGEKSGSLFQIQQSQNANLLVAGDISASGGQWLEGNLALGHSTAEHSVGGLTVSGSISASGTIYGDIEGNMISSSLNISGSASSQTPLPFRSVNDSPIPPSQTPFPSPWSA